MWDDFDSKENKNHLKNFDELEIEFDTRLVLNEKEETFEIVIQGDQGYQDKKGYIGY